jgi:hypothetical protein
MLLRALPAPAVRRLPRLPRAAARALGQPRHGVSTAAADARDAAAAAAAAAAALAAHDEARMRQALQLAHAAAAAGEVPVGAVLEHEGRVLALAHNQSAALVRVARVIVLIYVLARCVRRPA